MVDYKTMQLATCGGWNPLWLLVIGLCLSMEKPMFKARVAYHNMNYAYRWAYYHTWLKYREVTAAHVPFTPEAVTRKCHGGCPEIRGLNVHIYTSNS